MLNSTAVQPRLYSRLTLLLTLIPSLLLASGCGLFGTHKKVQVPQLLTPLAEADTPRLISEVNRLAAVQPLGRFATSGPGRASCPSPEGGTGMDEDRTILEAGSPAAR